MSGSTATVNQAVGRHGRQHQQSSPPAVGRQHQQSSPPAVGRPSRPGKFCKVCFDAGKSETEYTSHFVKDRPGKGGLVVCPTINNVECRYCHQVGHTVKYCKMIEEKEKQAKKFNALKQITNKNISSNKNTNNISNTNPFEILMNDDNDDMMNDQYDQYDQYESVSSISTKKISGWAAVLANPAPIQEAKTESIQEAKTEQNEDTPNSSVVEGFVKPRKRILNWADCDSDSDLSDEE
jgi:hypothetical protein